MPPSTVYIRDALGPRAAFLSGWLYWYFWVIATGAETIAGASLLHDWVALPVWLIGVVLIALLTAINLMSVKAYGEFEFWFSLVKVAAIVGFIAVAGGNIGLLALEGRLPTQGLAGAGGLLPHGFATVLAAVPVVQPPDDRGGQAYHASCLAVLAELMAAEATLAARNREVSDAFG